MKLQSVLRLDQYNCLSYNLPIPNVDIVKGALVMLLRKSSIRSLLECLSRKHGHGYGYGHKYDMVTRIILKNYNIK